MRWLKDLWKKIQKWWKKRNKKRPKGVENVQTEVTMTDVTIEWTVIPEREKGGPLPPEEIAHTKVELSADGGSSYGEVAKVLPTEPQQYVQTEMEPGQWHFQLTVVDTEGRGQKTPHVEVVQVADDSPPAGVTSVVVTQT